MRVQVSFDELWSAVRQITDEVASFEIVSVDQGFDPIDIQLSGEGIEVTLEQVESTQGLLTFKERQVLLYIQDHGWRVMQALEDGSRGKKFHVSWCQTLEEMRAKGRFERYVATADFSSSFYISGQDENKKDVDGETELQVCKNCLEKLNYKDSASSSKVKREVCSNFSIGEFFETYSAVFKFKPKFMSRDAAVAGYSSDWQQISSAIRQARNYTCEECNVYIENEKRLLHVHHANGNKGDNRPENLKALCVACHKLQPFHDHMHVTRTQMIRINELRAEQGLLGERTWPDVLRLADTSLTGALLAAKRAGSPPPVLGFEIGTGTGSAGHRFDAAWPRAKVGLSIEPASVVGVQHGWSVLGSEEFLSQVESGMAPR